MPVAPPPLSNPPCFALFDDCDASDAAPRSRLYTGLLRTIACHSSDALTPLLQALQQPKAHAVIHFSYELGAALQGIEPRAPTMLAQVLLFECCAKLSRTEVDDWLQQHDDHLPSGVADVHHSLDQESFADALAQIRRYIAAGDTYQVNFTLRTHFESYGEPLALYRRLRARQPVPYGALIRLPDGAVTLSLSPELFVRHQAGALLAQPMKGTARASGEADDDAQQARLLAADPKNRAENLMIVDLLRNDLGRVAVTGSVAVPELFQVKRFGDVLQMTSTVTARLRADVELSEVVAALYPCGSITGAPKRRSMQIIRELETTPRGVYTGAIGWFDPPEHEQAIGDFCLSVPIRTLSLQAPNAAGVRRGEMGVGAGIVYDSVAREEWEECALKAQFLTGLPPQFSLFETMAVDREHGCGLLERHLERLARSARYFNFPFDGHLIRCRIEEARRALPDAAFYRLRLSLAPDGQCSLQCSLLQPLNTPVRLILATQAMRADDLFLRHKTTLRARYDAAWQDAEAQGAFDMLFCNEHGDVTEGARSSLFVQIDGAWFTPPLSAGILPGVMRASLLDDVAFGASERRLRLTDVHNAQRIVVCNALRGLLPAVLVP